MMSLPLLFFSYGDTARWRFATSAPAPFFAHAAMVYARRML
jgi:hypothetical protein